MKNLILTPAIGVDSVQSELFIKSLRKYYNDEAYFLVGKNDNDLKKILTLNQCKYIETNVHKFDIQIKRYNYFLKILKEAKYKQVLFCDSRDIYFQSNPFNYNFKGSINFFLEDRKIKECPHNINWFLKTYGKKTLDELSENIISCGGTILGNHHSMEKFIEIMIDQLSRYKFKKRLKYLLTLRRDKMGRGSDQAHGNFIAHKKLIENSFFYSNAEGPIASAYYLKKISFNKNSELINGLGEPYSVVHQYDKRWSEFKPHVDKLKKNLNI